MRKIFILSLLLPFALSNVNAQSLEDLRFGVTGGLNLSNMTNFDSKASFHLGLKAEKSITENVFIEGSVLYSAKGAKMDFGDLGSNKINANYIEVPIHIGYVYNINPELDIRGSVGPYFAYGIGGKMEVSESDWYYDSYENTKYNTFSDDSGLKRFDLGLGFKAGVEYKNNYQLSIGYDFGLIDTYNKSKNEEDYDVTGTLKNSNFKVSVAYMF